MCILSTKETKEIIDILNGKNGQAKTFSDEELKLLKLQLNESFNKELSDIMVKYEVTIEDLI